MKTVSRGVLLASLVFAASALVLCPVAQAAPTVTHGEPGYGIWAPEFREAHVRIPLKADAGGGDDTFTPRSVKIDGKQPPYAVWYFDGTPFDYAAITNASGNKIEVFAPVFWKAGEEHTVELSYYYSGAEGSLTVKATTPATGGVWNDAKGPGNLTFCVREEAGLPRTNELVEVDSVIERAVFPDPEKATRATLYASGHKEVPCQVYEVESVESQPSLVRFRAAVLLSVPATGEVIVCLWNTDGARPAPVPGPLAISTAADATVIANSQYSIRLSPLSGQLMSWKDLQRGILFDYQDPRKLEESARVINRTPDVYRTGKPWSHALDWQPGQYQQAVIKGPVFIETTRWGKMPFTDDFSGCVRYRFIAGRPEMFMTSVLSADKDTEVLGVRNGGVSLTPALFTHVAHPRQNGTVESVPLERAVGNDTGAPAAARMPIDTPWLALYNKDKGYGFAVHTLRQAYYQKGPFHPSTARGQSYVSVYRHYTVYSIRSMTQTYYANIRSLPVPLHAGTELYEDMVFVPFTFQGEGPAGFRTVEERHRRLMNPLVVVP